MKRFVFFFLGVIETGSDADVSILKTHLENALTTHSPLIRYELKEELLTLTLSKPDFRFYISFVKNDRSTLADWRELAKNFQLPWDIKPVNKLRLENIFSRLEAKGQSEYKPFHKLSYIILEEMEKFPRVKVFTIPSMGKLTFWSRF
jgi:hypothetical protein